MKDLIGREVKIGQYIAYALIVGRSVNLAIYRVKEVFEDKIKALKIDESYNWNETIHSTLGVPWRYIKWDRKTDTYVEMSDKEKEKVDSTLSMSERIFILNDFDPSLFEGEQ